MFGNLSEKKNPFKNHNFDETFQQNYYTFHRGIIFDIGKHNVHMSRQ